MASLASGSHFPHPAIVPHSPVRLNYGSPLAPEEIHSGSGGSASTESQGRRDASSYFRFSAAW
jgi:hypothetical protein